MPLLNLNRVHRRLTPDLSYSRTSTAKVMKKVKHETAQPLPLHKLAQHGRLFPFARGLGSFIS